MDVFFVCGPPKSGTTWIQRILDAHPEVCCSGEGHFIDYFGLPLLKLLSAYNSRLNDIAKGVYESEPYYRPVDEATANAMVAGFMTSRMLSRRTPGVRWIGDKTPRYTDHLWQLNLLFPSAKFINVIRDPRDVVMSRLYLLQRMGEPEHLRNIGSPETVDLIRRMGRDWVRSMLPPQAFAEANPDQLIHVRYEDMLKETVRETRRLYDFLGVDTDDAVVEEIAFATSFRQLSGRERGDEAPDRYLRKGVEGDWKGRLGEVAQCALEESCGPLMREFGYA